MSQELLIGGQLIHITNERSFKEQKPDVEPGVFSMWPSCFQAQEPQNRGA